MNRCALELGINETITSRRAVIVKMQGGVRHAREGAIGLASLGTTYEADGKAKGYGKGSCR